MNVGNDDSLDVGNVLTIESWVKPHDLSARQGIFSTRLYNTADSFQLEIGPGHDGSNRVAVCGPGTWIAETEDDVIESDEWNHIAWTYSDSGNLAAYINGENVRSGNFSGNITLNEDDLILASAQDYDPYLGLIDEIRVWDIVRDSVQIRENMYLPLTGYETGLVSYWQFNDGSGTSLIDEISGNDGTLINMDEEDWIDSTIPFGSGVSDTQTETAGTVDFTGTDLSMYFNSHNGAEITVTRIDTTANINPTEPDEVFDAQYWS